MRRESEHCTTLAAVAIDKLTPEVSNLVHPASGQLPVCLTARPWCQSARESIEAGPSDRPRAGWQFCAYAAPTMPYSHSQFSRSWPQTKSEG